MSEVYPRHWGPSHFLCFLPTFAVCLCGLGGYVCHAWWSGQFCKELEGIFVAIDWGEMSPARSQAISLGLPHSPKMSTNGDIRSGVCFACVKCLPASSRQAFSSSTFWWYSWRVSLVLPGAVTRANGLWVCSLSKAWQTLCTVFCICLVQCSCFHSVFLDLFQATNCACISWAIQVSLCVLSFFKLQNFLWAFAIKAFTSRVETVPMCSTCSMPAFSTFLSTDSPTFPLSSHLSIPFQKRIQLMAAIT